MSSVDPVAQRLRFLHGGRPRATVAATTTTIGTPVRTSSAAGDRRRASNRRRPQANRMRANDDAAWASCEREFVPIDDGHEGDDDDDAGTTKRPPTVAAASSVRTQTGRARRAHQQTSAPRPDFGAVLADRQRRSHWLHAMRARIDAHSDYERYALEYILRRRYDTEPKRAPHMSAQQYEAMRRAAAWERDVLFKAMQAEADRGRAHYVLHLDGPWCEKTLRTVREADLFGRAVTYLLAEVFHSEQLRVRCEAPTSESIRLCVSWDEVAASTSGTNDDDDDDDDDGNGVMPSHVSHSTHHASRPSSSSSSSSSSSIEPSVGVHVDATASSTRSLQTSDSGPTSTSAVTAAAAAAAAKRPLSTSTTVTAMPHVQQHTTSAVAAIDAAWMAPRACLTLAHNIATDKSVAAAPLAQSTRSFVRDEVEDDDDDIQLEPIPWAQSLPPSNSPSALESANGRDAADAAAAEDDDDDDIDSDQDVF